MALAALPSITAPACCSNVRATPLLPCPRGFAAAGPNRTRRSSLVAAAGGDKGGKGFLEKLSGELLDVATAGPKMRKWYGQQSNADLLPRDGGEPAQQQPAQQEPEPEQQPEQHGERDLVLVTAADSPTGELVVLQLILQGAKVRILVSDVAAAQRGFADYVEPLSLDIGSEPALARAMRGVKCVIALGRLGALLPAAARAGVPRLVLLSTAGMPQPGGLAALFGGGGEAELREPAREAAAAAAGISSRLIVKAPQIADRPGGASALALSAASLAGSNGSGSTGGGSGAASVSREDLATALVAAATAELPSLQGQAVLSVAEAGPGAPPDSAELAQQLDAIARQQAGAAAATAGAR